MRNVLFVGTWNWDDARGAVWALQQALEHEVFIGNLFKVARTTQLIEYRAHPDGWTLLFTVDERQDLLCLVHCEHRKLEHKAVNPLHLTPEFSAKLYMRQQGRATSVIADVLDHISRLTPIATVPIAAVAI